jgi:hypothetical protein
MTVCSRRAPMFSVRSFTWQAISAIRRTAIRRNRARTPSVASSAVYCW